MSVSLKVQIIAVIILGVSSFIWFLLGETAGFQRGMDIIGTTLLIFVAIPLLLFVGGITLTLVNQWNQTSYTGNMKLYIGLAIVMFLSLYIFANISSNSWTKETIESDTLKITADGKYKYRINLINLFQRNSRAQLYIKDVKSGKEIYIPVNIQMDKIIVLGVVYGKENHWIKLEPTDVPYIYQMNTTEELGIPIEKFKVNIKERTSYKNN